jgi:hypothetical protein
MTGYSPGKSHRLHPVKIEQESFESQPPVKIEQQSFESHVIEVPTFAFDTSFLPLLVLGRASSP